MLGSFTSNGDEDKISSLKALRKYNNFKQDRDSILKDCKDMTGIYLFLNNANGHTYVGSSINLAGRMRNYLNTSFLKSKQNMNMPIIKALLKYGHSTFSLWILERTELNELAIRETKYITDLFPYYNVLKVGYSSIGYKHTEETKALLFKLATNRVHSDETKALIARAVTGENNPFYSKTHSTETKVRMMEAKSENPVYIYDSFKKLIVVYPSVKSVAVKVHSNHATIVTFIKKQELFRGEWYFTNIPYNIDDTPKIKNWNTIQGEDLAKKMRDDIKIKKGVFVYDKNRKFLTKHTGVTEAGKVYKLSYLTIRKHASLNTYHNSGHYFCFERLEADPHILPNIDYSIDT